MNRKAIRRAFALTAELIGDAKRVAGGWAFDVFHLGLMKWETAHTKPLTYNEVRRVRKAYRLARVANDLDMTTDARAVLRKLARTTARPDKAISQALAA